MHLTLLRSSGLWAHIRERYGVIPLARPLRLASVCMAGIAPGLISYTGGYAMLANVYSWLVTNGLWHDLVSALILVPILHIRLRSMTHDIHTLSERFTGETNATPEHNGNTRSHGVAMGSRDTGNSDIQALGQPDTIHGPITVYPKVQTPHNAPADDGWPVIPREW